MREGALLRASSWKRVVPKVEIGSTNGRLA
jgi:hypothetical protein